ncbi:outer membrane beta-barrel protein [Bradyrhizobium barranii subsp. barranii]|nr:outer membrane beta-barrel protein [Bradyrhizobium barranii]UGX92584.1 outer membrane beta-barrel protein [Bradyrhizobium barranii subsp. barranii]
MGHDRFRFSRPCWLKALLASNSICWMAGLYGPAHAADLPVKTAPPITAAPSTLWNWTGIYVGAHLGGAFGSSDWQTATGLQADFSNRGFPGSGNAEGLLGGGQIGVNYQFGTWVTGLEIAASAADVDGFAKCANRADNRYGVISFTCDNRVTSLGTIAGRLGQTWGNLLIYGKAGAAWATDESDARTSHYINKFNQSGTRSGWMGGLGLEYAFSPNLSAFVEYDHFDFGSKDSNYVDQFNNASTVGFRQRFDMIKAGVNYGLGGPILNARADAATTPVLLGGWTIEAGSRYFGSTGRMQKDLYGSRPTHLVSRLIYGDQTGHAAETFFRFDHKSGFFARGNLGLGPLVDGKLNDEDFPYINYSNTNSDMKSGRFTYGTADVGYNFINDDGRRLGAYVGYHSFYERANGFGIQQQATNGPPLEASKSFLVLSETETWRAAAIGINAQARLSDRLKLEVDAAYLPYASRSGFDNHWLRADINPTPDPGHGWGTQFEAVLSYAVSDRFSVGVGGRYWFFTTDSAYSQFPGGSPQTTKFYSERYGGFLQASYKSGELDTAQAKANGIDKEPPPVMPTNWAGVYLGGTIGAGKGRSHYADPFPTPVSGDYADLGGAMFGGQIGINYQTGSWVLGLEASGYWANVQGTNTCFGAFPSPQIAGFNCGSQIDALGALTGRVGYAFDRTLLYVKGGSAWDRQTNQFNTGGISGTILTNGNTNWGWTVGGGLEYALLPNWSMALEYKYYDFGKSPVFTTAGLGSVPLSPNSTTVQTVSLGVNYKLPILGAR